jgi:SAM-dependent methyltransferase
MERGVDPMRRRFISLVGRALPGSVRAALRSRTEGGDYHPPIGKIRFGDLRRLEPLSRKFGYDRGQPVDRYYIEQFLARHADDIRGRVLEIGDDAYTRRFGRARVSQSDVLHIKEGHPGATIIADLSRGEDIPSGVFDCVILTQTLHLVYDVPAALRTLVRILKPGGVLLATVPGITQIDRFEWRHSWYWAFTTVSAQRRFEEVFPAANLTLATYGNVLAATAFLYGIAYQELRPEELDHRDIDYEVTITVRAVKPRAST